MAQDPPTRRARTGTSSVDSDAPPTVGSGRVGLGEAHIGKADPDAHSVGQVLGRGGMGEVRMARDRSVGRWVALKTLLDEETRNTAAVARFVREARIQGQLEHPGVVPVYSVRLDEAGRPHFTMRRIAGITLRDVVEGLRLGDPDITEKYTQRRILTALQQVCLTLHYAHTRGVVHRDIKLSNLMLGDFGEVYVLDWGIAKLVDVPDQDESGVEVQAPDVDATNRGQVLGTVGCMAPEQLLDSASVDARADIYSLGAVLFHALTLEPLHGRGTAVERRASTLRGAEARASERAPDRDIAPELDAICIRATQMDPAKRHPSARAMHDAIERFLEGERDLQLRAELAHAHVARAQHAAAQALSEGDDVDGWRATALQEAGRAIALDPANDEAADVLARIMLEPPKSLPAEVEAESIALGAAETQRTARTGRVVLGVVLLAIVLLAWIGIRSWPPFIAEVSLVLVAFLTVGRWPRDINQRALVQGLLICTAIGLSSTVAGPLVLPPLFALAYSAIITGTHGFGRVRILLIVMAMFSVAIPMILGWVGVIESQYTAGDDVLVLHPFMVDVTPLRAQVAVLLACLLITGAVCAALWRFRADDVKNRHQLQLLAWHLRQVTPRAKEDQLEEVRTRHSDPPPAVPLTKKKVREGEDTE